MLRRLNNKGQMNIGEYVFIAVVVIIAISVGTPYLRRAFQATIKDARDYMIKGVRQVHADTQAFGKVHDEYEPYYTQSDAVVHSYSDTERTLAPGPRGEAAVFNQEIVENRTVASRSFQLPARGPTGVEIDH